MTDTQETIVKLWVVIKEGCSIPGYGWRAHGEYFDLPDYVAAGFAGHPHFSLTDPKPKTEKPTSLKEAK